jgi:hypothetical protein
MAKLGRNARRDREGMSECKRHNIFSRHRPPAGLAFGEPDDRLQRATQYDEASVMDSGVRGVLGHPVEPGDDGFLWSRAVHHTQAVIARLRPGDPVFRGVSDRIEKARRTGSPAFAGDDSIMWSSVEHNHEAQNPNSTSSRPR